MGRGTGSTRGLLNGQEAAAGKGGGNMETEKENPAMAAATPKVIGPEPGKGGAVRGIGGNQKLYSP